MKWQQNQVIKVTNDEYYGKITRHDGKLINGVGLMIPWLVISMQMLNAVGLPLLTK